LNGKFLGCFGVFRWIFLDLILRGWVLIVRGFFFLMASTNEGAYLYVYLFFGGGTAFGCLEI
jgi:hypothetical protein